jgi:multiple sugar transport system ATP-binding protein
MVDVRLDTLRKEFGSIVAVNDFDLTIHEDEFVTLVGPSGCGKTTTLRMVAGLETPTSGNVQFGDRDVSRLPPQQRDVALLFQDIALYPHMSVRENMAYGLKIAGVTKDTRNERVEDVAEMLQIGDLLSNKPGDLSGGQQQRVALGRSMVRDPTVFLFDEPMSDLDAKLKRELRPLFEEVTREIGCPTLYVTHDQEEAMSMSDRVAVMNEGEPVQVGSPEEVYDDPNSRFMGEFIGQPTMEFFETTLVANGDGMAGEIGGERWELPGGNGLDEYDGRTVHVGVRPQDIDVADDPAEGIPARHLLDEPLGDRTHSFFEPDGEDRITVVTPSKFRGGEREYGLVLDTTAAKVFDAESGVRVG